MAKERHVLLLLQIKHTLVLNLHFEPLWREVQFAQLLVSSWDSPPACQLWEVMTDDGRMYIEANLHIICNCYSSLHVVEYATNLRIAQRMY